jgi:hypothetical protein
VSPRVHSLVLALALGLCASAAGTAHAAQSARIAASFLPERLGSATTVTFTLAISSRDRAPSALTGIDLAFPSNLGFATSGLGVAACPLEGLEEIGSAVCPADSRMGYGGALVEIPIGPDVVREKVALEVFAGPSPDGYLHILVYASGVFPVYAQVVLPGVLLSGRLRIVVPPIPSLPAGPYVAVTHMQLTLGGHLTYYERVGATSVAYRPPGVGLPRSCPHGGFAFGASFAFLDGTRSHARTAVPCPHQETVRP